MLFWSLIISLCIAVYGWEKVVIPVPMLNDSKFSFPLQAVRESLGLLKNKKCIWVMGKFKVGKSFLIDYIRKDTIVSADAVENTLGLHAWVDKKAALIDTEGLMQPVGENNVYFLKEFLINLMRRTADNFVFVTDQVDVVDLEFYNIFKSLYWNNDINQMYQVHNCKSLNAVTLQTYKERMKKLKSLDEDDVDVEFRGKPIQHLFIPKLSDSSLYNFLMAQVGMGYEINFVGDVIKKRDAFNLDSYMKAVDDSLLALGSYPLEELADEKRSNTVERQEFHPIASELFPNNLKWCKEIEGNYLRLYVETTKINVISPSGLDISITMNTLDKNFVVEETTVRIAGPVPIQEYADFNWECASTNDGYQIIRFRYVRNADEQKLRHCPAEAPTFTRCGTYQQQAGAPGEINWDYILTVLSTVSRAIDRAQSVGEFFIALFK